MSFKLWSKVTSVSVNINFGEKKMSILCQKNINFGRNVDFFIKCALLLKVIIFLQNCLFLEKCEFLCEGLYTLTKCQILIKTSIS